MNFANHCPIFISRNWKLSQRKRRIGQNSSMKRSKPTWRAKKGHLLFQTLWMPFNWNFTLTLALIRIKASSIQLDWTHYNYISAHLSYFCQPYSFWVHSSHFWHISFDVILVLTHHQVASQGKAGCQNDKREQSLCCLHRRRHIYQCKDPRYVLYPR